MLRIVTRQDGDTWTLLLHGRLAESWVELLERQWQSRLETVHAGNVTVLLSDGLPNEWPSLSAPRPTEAGQMGRLEHGQG